MWLKLLATDYLAPFLSQGGSAVKVVVAEQPDRDRVQQGLASMAADGRYLYAHVDSATCRIHLLHTLYNEIARQVPWAETAQRFLRSALEEAHYRVPTSGDLSLEALADENDEASAHLVQHLRRIVTQGIAKNYAFSREFRLAADALCRATYDGSADVRRQADDVQAWLKGELTRLSTLRDLAIYRKIGRGNARQILSSTSAWLRQAGFPGIIVTVDFSRYALGKTAGTDGFTYTKLATLDMHEVLRQFVDSADELTSMLLVFLTGEQFLESEDRGLRNYDALRLRLTDDVRDRHHPNPFAPMVRLRSAA
jgi:hypothetical protein